MGDVDVNANLDNSTQTEFSPGEGQGPNLLTNIDWDFLKAWIRGRPHCLLWDVINHPCLNFAAMLKHHRGQEVDE